MNNKVYIVTSGSYSDYNIKRCFLDKEKAEKYIEICGDADVNELEEYDLDDNLEFKPAYYLHLFYSYDRITYNGKSEPDRYIFNLIKTNEIDNYKHYEWASYTDYNSWKEIRIKKHIYNHNFNENDLKEKYKKVCEDLRAKINYFIEVEGWTKEMIEKWIGNDKEYIPENE